VADDLDGGRREEDAKSEPPLLLDDGSLEPAPPSQVRLVASGRSSARSHDAALVRAALSGDRSAAPAIVKRYRPLVRRYVAFSLAGEVDDHEQEVFARCFERLGHLRDPSSLRSFIIGITLRLVGSERRRRRVRRLETLTTSGELPERVLPEEGVDSRQAVWRTREILGRMRPESCQLLELRFVQERKLKEVAASMGVSVATAKRQLARASARIRALAKNEEVVVEYVRDALGGP
jgi:RNA polymerase sigma-70 factor (ECF subfamily)